MRLILEWLLLSVVVEAKEKKKHKQKGFSRPRITLEPRDQIAKWDETSKSAKVCVEMTGCNYVTLQFDSGIFCFLTKSHYGIKVERQNTTTHTST